MKILNKTHHDCQPATLIIKDLGHQDYETVWQAMKDFTLNRTPNNTPDQIWLVEHPPVFTQGQNGKPEHVLNPGDIPVIPVDRGGQVTYHGPGQLVVYFLLDLKRLNLNVRPLVTAIEQSIISFLAEFDISSQSRRDAPGVYVEGAKICAIGLRIKRGFSYHGLAFNIQMDLKPFSRINPCGMQNLAVTQLSALIGATDLNAIKPQLVAQLQQHLGYTATH